MILLEGDALHKLKELDKDSIDTIITDPPYGYAFMNKDWDKAVISSETWKECLRVLKPGAFAAIMSSPRQDVLSRMIVNLQNAGFRTDFTSIYWTYSQGFPKAANISKLVDKREGGQRNKIPSTGNLHVNDTSHGWSMMEKKEEYLMCDHNPVTDKAKELDGSYAGFQPKPAIEVILMVMKPLSEKTFVDQALKNGKGITWLDSVRIPFQDSSDYENALKAHREHPSLSYKQDGRKTILGNGGQSSNSKGRFPANLLVSDSVLKDHSKYFSLDKWFETTFPFIITPKPSPAEKNKGLDKWIEPKKEQQEFRYTKMVRKNKPDFKEISEYLKTWIYKKYDHHSILANDLDVNESLIRHWTGKSGNQDLLPTLEYWLKLKEILGFDDKYDKIMTEYVEEDRAKWGGMSNGTKYYYHNHINNHPTVKPLKLMSYLVAFLTKEGETVLDPFCGSGTTLIAAKILHRKYVGIELNPEYIEIAKARLNAYG